MPQWNDVIRNHPVHEAFSELDTLLTSLAVPEGHTVGEETIFRVRAVVRHVVDLLRAADPLLVNPAWLNQFHKQINAIRNELQAFPSDNNEGHFQNANNHADALLEAASRLTSAKPPGDAQGVVESISQAREHADRVVDHLRQRSQEAEARIAQTDASAQQLRADLEATRSEVSNQRARLDSVISEFQSQFSDAEDRRRQGFEQLTQQFNERAAQAVTEERQRVDSLLKKLDEDSAGTISQLEQRKREASDLVQVIGNVGVTGNFKEVADANKASADRWRLVALAFMLCIIVGVAATIKMAARPEAEWHQIAIRVGITLALAVPAGYAARESAGHRKVERDTRSFELQLASLDPYLEKLPEAERHEVKKKLSERFFGGATSSQSSEEAPISKQSDVVGATIKELVDLAKRAIDALARK